MVRVLAHAHSFGVLHRDIKPDNTLRGHDGVWRVCDFGVAAWTGMETSPIVGSPHYMAPEQITGSLLLQATWTDLYAVGCVGWELVTGAPPFQGTTHQEVFHPHLQTEPPPYQRPGLIMMCAPGVPGNMIQGPPSAGGDSGSPVDSGVAPGM